MISDHLGITVKRNYNLGSHEDVGDITVNDTTVQVANWKNLAQAIRHKPLECEQQRQRAGTTHAATFIRLTGGEYRVVMTPEQYFAIWREAVEL